MGSGASALTSALLRRGSLDPSCLPEASIDWILMGEPSSGRRTLAKHLKLLYTTQSVDDLEEGNRPMREMIMASVTQQLQILAQVAENQLDYEFGDFEFGSTVDIRHDLEMLQHMRLDTPWTSKEADLLTRLWATPAMQGSFCDRGIVNLSGEVRLGLARPVDESLAYFCEPKKMNDLLSPNYVPSFQDYLKFPQQHNLEGVKNHRLLAGSGENEIAINLTTLLNTPTQKWLSTIEYGSLVTFCVALPCLPISVKGNRMNSCDYNRLKTARSLFSNVVNTPLLKFSPVVLVFTKADLCVMEDPDKITEIIHSFIVLNKREMSVRVLLSDNTSSKKVRSLFVGLMRATIELGMESSKLSE